jgi:outer membrane immunogenic protein
MKRMILGVAAALLLSAGPAAADGLPSKGSVRAPEVSTGPNWNGFYVGVGIGAGAALTDFTEHGYEWTRYGYQPFSYEADSLGGQGIFGTAVLGYDRMIRPDWVLGAFVDYDFGSNIRFKESNDEHGSYNDYSNHIDLDHAWSVGLRLGYLPTPSTLVYATGGYTQAEFDISNYGSHNFDGYFVGAGLETFLRSNVTLKLEYRFTQFNDKSFDFCDNWSYGTDNFQPSEHSARLVLSYKFGEIGR